MSYSQQATLDSVCALIADCPHSTPRWTEDGYLVIRNQNIKNGKLDLSERSYTDLEHYQIRIRRAKPQFGDLILTREAPMGDVCMVPDGLECCVGQRQVLLRPNQQKILPRFLLYAIQSPAVQHEISWSEGTGSTVSNIRIPVLKRIKVPLLPIAKQHEIAETLGALDDRIALLRETNATLEAIAQALFKSWFVDFDPVRARMEGRAPEGMDDATAALFPDSFEESELGLIPKGWSVGSILETANLLSGGTPKTDRPEYWGGDIAWASAKDVSQSNSSVLLGTERTITRRGLEESATRLIPAFATVVVARGATTGRMVLFGQEAAMNQTCYALTSKMDTPVALYCQLRREIEGLVSAAHGSVFDTITTSTFAQSKIVLPAHRVLARFEAVAAELFKKIIEGTGQAQTLATLRDTLLPRLISGQLRLPDAEAMAAETA